MIPLLNDRRTLFQNAVEKNKTIHPVEHANYFKLDFVGTKKTAISCHAEHRIGARRFPDDRLNKFLLFLYHNRI